MLAKRALTMALAFLLAVPPFVVGAALGTVTGNVVLKSGKPAADVDLELVNLDTGRSTAVRSDSVGAFKVSLDPGTYDVTVGGDYTLIRGPRGLTVAADATVSAEVVVEKKDRKLAAAVPGGGGGGLSTANKVALGVFAAGLATAVVVVNANKVASPSR